MDDPSFARVTNKPAHGGARANTWDVAIVVTHSGGSFSLSPFFNRSDGLLLIDTGAGAREFRQRQGATGGDLAAMLMEIKPQKLICGFVRPPDEKRLRKSGVDVRLGSCARSIDDLTANFDRLPKLSLKP